MAVTSIDLHLEGDNQVYISGQRVKGSLVLHIGLPVIIAGVEVRFRGAARAKWSETVQSGTHRTDIEHEKEEIYFDDRFCLWGKVNAQSRWEGREVLQRGRHMFPFQYKVPEGVPCSFEGPDAHVRYNVQGIIIRYNGECISTQRIINVLRDYDPKKEPCDLSSANSTQHPLEDHSERSVHTFCCRPGRVSCSISLPKRAYVPGEILRAAITVHNLSIRKSGAVSLQLKQIISYGGVHTRTMLLKDLKVCDSLRPGQHRHWREYPLRVPSLCPSRLHMCKVLDLRYCVAVEASFADTVLYAAVPVTIATVPDNDFECTKWSYKYGAPPLMTDDAVTDCYIYGCTRAESEEEEFKPKYKYFEDLRDIRREKDILLKLRQSPGIKRRKDKDKTKGETSRPCVKLKSDEVSSASQA
ncbi:arrestin domain-containing protein 17-like isoform X2 [Mizuhopecten yessoensis]|uniref:arrestin domain-containing protein 17-like isoform X2 n=1 Tax=Mizuhopecten yessoensis TaxID=6573 RepID=UPI000B45EA31|nr:arrestin domain-containing protein 17-like isoform X2 [Mizuhopecten yessoensis]